jgi:CBS domain-containing protein
MSVNDILSSKGTEIFSVTETAPLREAIQILNTRNIGVVLIINEGGKLAGILSERDIIRRSLAQETGFRDEPVKKSMTKDVYTVTSGATVDQVMELMTKSRIRHVPVVDEGTVIGLISIGDVVKRKIAEAEHEAEELRQYIATA